MPAFRTGSVGSTTCRRPSMPSARGAGVWMLSSFTCCCIALLVALCGAQSTSAPARSFSGSWRLSRSIFSQREKPAAACTGFGTIVTVGGTSAFGNRRDAWMHHPSNETWEELHPFGQLPALNAATLAFAGSDGFLFGGQFSDRLGTASGALYRLRNVPDGSTAQGPATWDVIETPANARIPDSRYRHSAVEVPGGFIILFGISHVQLFNDVWRYHANNASWTELSSNGANAAAPAARYNPCCMFLEDDHVIVCYGGTLRDGDTSAIVTFNVSTNAWGTLTASGATPSPRRLAQCVPRGSGANQRIVMFSGFSSTDGVIVEDVLHTYYFGTQTWANTTLVTVPPPRSGGVMITCGGTVSMFGGTDETVDYNDVWTLSDAGTFTLQSMDQPIPPGRLGHLGVISGDEFFVMLGTDADEAPLSDVWSFNFVRESWRLYTRTFPFEPRTQSTAVMFGSFVWVFGGSIIETGTFTNDVLVFDTGAKQWAKADSVNDAPPPRARHAAVAAVSMVVVFGGETATEAITDYAAVLSVPEQRWYTLLPEPGSPVPPARRGHSMTFNSDTNETIIIGGFGGQNTLSDRWAMTMVSRANRSVYLVRYRQLASVAADGMIDTIRTEMTTVSSGTHAFVIGGAISTLFPPAPRAAVYQWDSRSGANRALPQMPSQTFASAGAFFQRSIYVYGGGLGQNGVKRAHTVLSTMQVFTFDSSMMCASGAGDDSTCLHCSLGTLDPDCRLLAAGLYKPTNHYPALPCPRGTASPNPGTFQESSCERCSGGTYNNHTGQAVCLPCPDGSTCLIGATEPIPGTLSLAEAESSIQPTFPDAKSPVSLTMLAVFIAAALLALVIPTIILDAIDTKRQRMHYLGTQAIGEIKQAYSVVAFHRVSIPRDEAMVALSVLRRTADLPKDKLEMVVNTLQATFGTYTYMTEAKLQDVIIACILAGLLDPYPDTPCGRDEEFKRVVPWFPTIDLKRVDFLQVEHRCFTGQNLIKRKTTRGGFITMLAAILVLVFVSLQVTQYYFENVLETRSILPSMIKPLQPFAEIRISVEIDAEQGVCNAPNAAEPNTCLAINAITPEDVIVASDAVVTQKCYSSRVTGIDVHGRANCTMEWYCSDCSLKSGNASVEFYFGDSRTYSTTTTVRMWSTTGIKESTSFAWHRFSVSNPRLLRRGFPTTLVEASLLKTSVDVDFQNVWETPTQTSGYHVEFEPELRTDGNVVTARTFSLFTGLPVTVMLREQANTLFIKRGLETTFLDFISALLGGISGVVGAAVVTMRTWEFLVDLNRSKKRAKEFRKELTTTHATMLAGATNTQSGTVTRSAGFSPHPSGDDLEELLCVDVNDPIGNAATVKRDTDHPTLLVDPQSTKLDNARRFQMQLLELVRLFV